MKSEGKNQGMPKGPSYAKDAVENSSNDKTLSDLLDFPGLIAAAHELKTPLVLIRQLSLLLTETDDRKQRDELTRRIRLTSEKSLRLVDGLTKAVRADDGLFACVPVHIASVCEEVVDELSPLATAMSCQIALHAAVNTKNKLVAVGNRELTRALLLGLVDNALSYADGADVNVNVRRARSEILVEVRDHNAAVIDNKELARIERGLVHGTTPTSRPLSSGLGLMIAGKFAAAQRGRLSVTRHHAGGMTFRAHLPVSSQLSLLGSM